MAYIPPDIDFGDQDPNNHSYPVLNDIDEMLRLNSLGLTTKDQVLRFTTRGAHEISLDKFITADPTMLEMKRRVELIIRLPYNRLAPVLITGPSGTGKEIIAQAFRLPNKPFVSRNCAGFPKDLIQSILFGHVKGAFSGATETKDGIFIQAGEGIVFLDEIAELPLEAQAILLRVLQERTVTRLGPTIDEHKINCRVIAATKMDLRSLVQIGAFREDLFARLMTFEIHISGLLERPDDIPLIAAKGFDQFNQPLNYTQPLTALPTNDIALFNVRAIQSFVARMRTYGKYL